MGVMDREWYRERFGRRVLGVSGRLDDPMGEPARIRRGAAELPRRVPKGAEAGNFWVVLALIAVGVVGVVLAVGALR